MAYIRKKDGIFRRVSDGRNMLHQGYATSIFWSPQMIADLNRFFPTNTNQECAELLGLSVRTVVRKARQLGLQKDPDWLRNIWNQNRFLACVAARSKGYPGTFKKGNMIGFEYRFKKKQNAKS